MSIFQALVLGLVQGLTEFIPVSSSAHLVIVPYIFNWQIQSLGFDIFMHFATLLALLFYFRKLLIRLAQDLFSKEQAVQQKAFVMLRNIVITTIPAIIFFILISDYLDSVVRTIPLIAISLAFAGILLIVTEAFFKNNQAKYDSLSIKGALIVGVCQAAALIRGFSRSGSSIIGGLIAGLDKKEATEYGFLAGIPAILGSFVVEAIHLLKYPLQEPLLPLIVGFITAMVSGYLAIRFLLNFLKNHQLAVFGYYRVIVGILLILSVVL